MTGGFLSPLWFTGISAELSPGITGPATILDDAHTYQILINGQNVTNYWKSRTLSIDWPEAGEIGTAHVTLANYNGDLDDLITEWQEFILKVDHVNYFGGYVISYELVIDEDEPDGYGGLSIAVEEWQTLIDKTPAVRRAYVGETPGDILADLFNYALDPDGSPPNQTLFDTSTYVETVTTWSTSDPVVFLVDDETLSDAINRLALIMGFVWWIDADRAVHFGDPADTAAPFEIAAISAADYSSSFPPESRPSHRKQGSDIRNRVTVNGGVQVLSDTDDFVGDGSTSIFALSHFPILDMVLITADGALLSWGTYFYHTWAQGYDVLIDWDAGIAYFDPADPPASSVDLHFSYLYGDPVVVRVDNGTGTGSSYDTYGRWFDYEITDRTITSPVLAELLAQAIVDEFEFGVTAGVLAVHRLGIKPGQTLTVNMAAINLSGDYVVRRVATEVMNGLMPRCEISFGGRPLSSFSMAFSGNRGGGPVTRSGSWTQPRASRTLANRASLTSGSVLSTFSEIASNDLAANTNSPSGATAYQWPVYDALGNLAGYVPVYGSAW